MRLLGFNFFSCDLAEVHHRCLGNHLAPCHCSNMGKWDGGWKVREKQHEGRRRVTGNDVESSKQRMAGWDRFSCNLNIQKNAFNAAKKLWALAEMTDTLLRCRPTDGPPPLTGAEVLEKSWDAQQVHGLFMPSGYFWTLCPRLQKKKEKKKARSALDL